MVDQETLRKQLAADFTLLNLVNRIYEDEVDLPQAMPPSRRWHT